MELISHHVFLSREELSPYLLPWEMGKRPVRREDGSVTEVDAVGAWVDYMWCPQGCVKYCLGGGMYPDLEPDEPLLVMAQGRENE